MIAGPPSTAVSATAPLGGWRQRSANIAPIARQEATLAASAMSSMWAAHVTPISADTMLPPTMDQGCASGLAGTANNSTAEAPIGAMNHGLNPCRIRWLSHAAQNTPNSAPRQPRRISLFDTLTGAGTNAASHWRALRANVAWSLIGIPID